MKLTIALTAAAVLLRFTTPGPGSYYVVTGTLTPGWVHIVASGHETNACHVVVTLPRGADIGLYWTAFFADN